MKKNFKTILMSMLAFASLSLGSCSKEDVAISTDPSNPPVVEGINTYATFNFKVEGNPVGRAASDLVEEGVKSDKISQLRLLIFSDAGDAVARLLESNILVAEEKSSISASVTSGAKRIFVVANEGATLAGKLNALTATSTIEEFYGLMTNAHVDANPVEGLGAEFTELITEDHMFFSSGASGLSKKTLHPGISLDASSGIGADATLNNFDFNLKRSIAKGAVAVGKAALVGDLTTNDDLFTFDNATMTYGVGNVNRSVHYTQLFANDTDNDSDSGLGLDKTTKPQAPYHNLDMAVVDYNQYFYNEFNLNKVLPVGATAVHGNSVYFTENSSKLATTGNATFFAIKAPIKAISAGIMTSSYAITYNAVGALITATLDAGDDAYTAGGSFYVIKSTGAIPIIDAAGGNNNRTVFVDKEKALTAIHLVLTELDLLEVAVVDLAAFKTAFDTDPNMLLVGGATLGRYFAEYKGACYYRLNIFEKDAAGNKFHIIRRNHDYEANITGFKKLGEATEGDLNKDPETPLDKVSTSVTADIIIQDWHTTIVDGGDL